MRISFSKYLCAVVAAKRNMELSVSQNPIDNSEIVHHFEAAWLKTLAP